MLMSLDIPREKALAYHLLMEKQGDKRGARPTLASLGEAPAVEPQAEPELAMELEATPEEPPAAKRGGKVKA
ncbi:MAG: hypothetical protein ACREQ5_01685 [Candidatus Dormibacteria bacterium]